ncbi:hypothetical protein D3C72_1684780 [compost metagenome]
MDDFVRPTAFGVYRAVAVPQFYLTRTQLYFLGRPARGRTGDSGRLPDDGRSAQRPTVLQCGFFCGVGFPVAAGHHPVVRRKKSQGDRSAGAGADFTGWAGCSS